MKRSDRFYWCVGCGRWHDAHADRATHLAMYCPRQAPTRSNFDGSLEELQRFLISQQLKEEDDRAFESRIDAAILDDKLYGITE